MRLHKEASDALVQIKVKDITKNLQNIHHSLLNNFIKLLKIPSGYILIKVTNMRGYKELLNSILNSTESRSQMMVNYLRNVFNMLAIQLFVLETLFNTFRQKGVRLILFLHLTSLINQLSSV